MESDVLRASNFTWDIPPKSAKQKEKKKTGSSLRGVRQRNYYLHSSTVVG